MWSRLTQRAYALSSPTWRTTFPEACFTPTTLRWTPRLATLALLDGAARCGAELVQGVEVTGLVFGTAGEVAGVRTSDGTMSTGAVVIACGAWSGEMLRGKAWTCRSGHERGTSLSHRSAILQT